MAVPGLDQVCGSNFAYQHHTLERCLDDMVELGRTTMELWGIAPHLHIPDIDGHGVKNVRKLLRERELTVACLTPEQVAYPSTSRRVRRGCGKAAYSFSFAQPRSAATWNPPCCS